MPPMTLGQFLSDVLKKGGWGAQEDLAKSLGVSPSALHAWKAGRKPRLSDCLRIARVFADDPIIRGDPATVLAMTDQAEFAELWAYFYPRHPKEPLGCVCTTNAKHHRVHILLADILTLGEPYSTVVAAAISAVHAQYSGGHRHGPYAPKPKKKKP